MVVILVVNDCMVEVAVVWVSVRMVACFLVTSYSYFGVYADLICRLMLRCFFVVGVVDLWVVWDLLVGCLCCNFVDLGGCVWFGAVVCFVVCWLGCGLICWCLRLALGFYV